MAHTWHRWLVCATAAGCFLAAGSRPSAHSGDGLRVYFGSLGTCPSSNGGVDTPHQIYTRARAELGLDFLAITERAPSSAVVAAAALVNSAFGGRFVALSGAALRTDTVEIIGGSCRPAREREQADDWLLYLNYLNAGFRLAPSARLNDDPRAPRGATEYRTAVLAPSLTEAALVDAIRQRRVYASKDRNLQVAFSINGHPLGSVVAVPAGAPLRIEVRLSDDDEPLAYYRLSLRRDVVGGPLDADHEVSGTDFSGDGTIVFTQFRRSTADEYFLLRVAQGDGDGADVVWTAPIWLVSTGGV